MYIYGKKEKKTYTFEKSTFGTNENEIMHYFQKGCTIRQIAEIIGISKSKVYRTIKANKTAENNQTNTIEIEVVPTINAANEIETKINELKKTYNDDLYFDVYRTIKQSLNTETNLEFLRNNMVALLQIMQAHDKGRFIAIVRDMETDICNIKDMERWQYLKDVPYIVK